MYCFIYLLQFWGLELGNSWRNMDIKRVEVNCHTFWGYFEGVLKPSEKSNFKIIKNFWKTNKNKLWKNLDFWPTSLVFLLMNRPLTNKQGSNRNAKTTPEICQNLKVRTESIWNIVVTSGSKSCSTLFTKLVKNFSDIDLFTMKKPLLFEK